MIPIYLRSREPIRYIVAGGTAFLCDISVLYFCTEMLGLHYLISNIFGYATGLVVSYWLNVKWVFSYRRLDRVGVEFTLFNIIVIIGLALNELLMYLLVSRFGAYYLYAKVVSSAMVVVFNYLAKKFILFHPYSSNRRE